MYNKNLGLEELVNLKDWQKVQDSFSDALGITLRTIDPKGKPITKISGPSRLCGLVSSDLPGYSKLREKCPINKEIKQPLALNAGTNFECMFGLDLFVLPIKASGSKVTAYIVMGPVILRGRKDKSTYKKYARKAGVDPETLIDALVEINVFSYNRARSITTLLSDMFSNMAQTGYHKKRLGEIAPEVMGIDPLFTGYYEEKILNALLNTCAIALDADSGSVMTVDKKTNHLHIKVASKIDDDIVKNTDIKMGEGIAGIAAATSEPIILPKDRGKNGLSEKMKRGYIKSSMIVPFSKASDEYVYGVMNLNIVRKNREFSDKDIAFIKELTNLASIALLPVK